ncbi:hypothetical protein BvCmsNSNP030_3401 [Escherichia coli]|nr:hypothetical protein BvCmsNSNP030_3401 [Escherichia coli]GCK81813.1 hypothetical protein BvCmsC51A_04128 [Escherichia coli]GDF04345.1 hypothetical protein BvCmsKKNP009_03489 [Escherichia coli]
MLGGADNPDGELPSYITGADISNLAREITSRWSFLILSVGDLGIREGAITWHFIFIAVS